MNKNFSIIRNVENCFFYPGRTWIAEFRQIAGMSGASFQSHLESGYFSRGMDFYKPICSSCQECIPVRLPVAEFKASKSQRKLWRQNSDLQLRVDKPRFSDQRLDLYARYHRSRWGWVSVDLEILKPHFQDHLIIDWGGAWELSYWMDGQLIGFGVLDETPDGANSRYFVYEPELGKARGLGIYSLMREIEWCQQNQKEFLYLGMYVATSPSMSYKVDFRPFELRLPGHGWVRVEDRKGLTALIPNGPPCQKSES